MKNGVLAFILFISFYSEGFSQIVSSANGVIMNGGSIISSGVITVNNPTAPIAINGGYQLINCPQITFAGPIVVGKWRNTTVAGTSAASIFNISFKTSGGTIGGSAGAWTITNPGITTIDNGVTTIVGGVVSVGEQSAKIVNIGDSIAWEKKNKVWLRYRLQKRYEGRVYRTPLFGVSQRYGVARLSQFGGPQGTEFWSHFDATQRSAATFVHNGMIHVLGEVPPDAAVEKVTSVVAKLNIQKFSGEVGVNIAQTIAELGQRTALVNIQRDALYRLSEYDYNHTHDTIPGLSQDNFRYLYNQVITQTLEAHKAQSESQAKLEEVKFKRDSLSDKLSKSEASLKTVKSTLDSLQKQIASAKPQAKDTSAAKNESASKPASTVSKDSPITTLLKALIALEEANAITDNKKTGSAPK